MNWLFFLLLTLAQGSAVPKKPVDEYKLELEYKFKKKPASENSYIDLTETVAEKERRTSDTTTPLPYLIIHMSFLKLSDNEVRFRCIDNNHKNRLSKKAELNNPYRIDLGFTDDMKDRITAYEYTFTLMDEGRNDTSIIVLRVEEDGTFLVNGVRKGKF